MHFSGEKYAVRPQQGHNRPQTCVFEATSGHTRPQTCVFEATSGHNRPQTCGFQATSGHNRPQTCRNKARPCGFEATSGQLVWFRDCFLGLDFQQVLGDQVVPVLYTCLPVYATPNLGSKNLGNFGFACVGLPCNTASDGLSKPGSSRERDLEPKAD